MSSRPGTRPASIGIVAESNGRTLPSGAKSCAKHGWYDATHFTCPLCVPESPKASTAARLATLEKDNAELRGLVLTLADGLSAARAAWRESVDLTTESLKNLQFSYSTLGSLTRTLDVRSERAEKAIFALNNAAQGLTREDYDALHAEVLALRAEVEGMRSLVKPARVA